MTFKFNKGVLVLVKESFAVSGLCVLEDFKLYRRNYAMTNKNL